MDLALKGRIALVTGGTSGIGRAIATALFDEGCEVHAADINLSAVQNTPGFDARSVRPLCMDVGDASGVQRAVDAIVAERGRIDILVNCAGILKIKPIVESTIADWDDVARVNLSGVYYCCKAVLPTMIAQRYGKIINIASVSSVKGGGMFGNVLYGTTKAGVVAMTHGFARELGPYGINVNAISPGNTATPLNQHLQDDPEFVKLLESKTPTGRAYISTDEMAGAAIFLASDDARAVHGLDLIVDDGWAAA